MPKLCYVSDAGRGKVTVQVKDEGVVTYLNKIDPQVMSARIKCAKELGIDDSQLLSLCLDAPTVWTYPDESAESEREYIIREIGIRGEDTVRLKLADVPGYIDKLPDVRTITWSHEDLCCLDIDYHNSQAPAEHWVKSWVRNRLHPKPKFWHLSRNGGLHLFYESKKLAACAAIAYKRIDSSAAVELKNSIRGSGKAEVHTYPEQDTSLAFLDREGWDDEALTAWLQDNDYVVGHRYPHSRCPIDPLSEGSRTPVQVLDHGIYCHKCAGQDKVFGSRRPGFVPWGTLLETGSGLLGALVRNKTHWGHARWVLTESLGLQESFARLAYEAMLERWHGEDDPLLQQVFHQDTMKLTRTEDSWFNIESMYQYPSSTISPILQQLPACSYVDEKGKIKHSSSTVAYFNQGHDLTDRGYPPVEVIHGFRMTSVWQDTPHLTQISHYPAELKLVPYAMPKYISGVKSEDVLEAQSRLDVIFPGIDWNVVRLLMCAVGSAQETRVGMPPLVFLTGPSGSSKTTTCRIAAAILGTRTTAITYSDNDERMKQAVREASVTSAMAVGDEFLKEAKRRIKKADPQSALESLFTITPDTAAHVMYVGPRRLGRVPAMILTEPMLPRYLRSFTQIARRIRPVRLNRRKDEWKQTMANAGVIPSEMHKLRMISKDIAHACNVIMSDVIDNFFSIRLSWDHIADMLDFPTLEDCEDFEDPTGQLLRFFHEVVTAPEMNDTYTQRYGVGYKRIQIDDPTELNALYTDLADSYRGKEWLESTRLTEADWTYLLRTSIDVQCDLKNNGSDVFVRFRQGPARNPTALNGSIEGYAGISEALRSG